LGFQRKYSVIGLLLLLAFPLAGADGLELAGRISTSDETGEDEPWIEVVSPYRIDAFAFDQRRSLVLVVADGPRFEIYDRNLALLLSWTFPYKGTNEIAVDEERGVAYWTNWRSIVSFGLRWMTERKTWWFTFSPMDVGVLQNGSLLIVPYEAPGNLWLFNTTTESLLELHGTGEFGEGSHFIQDPTRRRIVLIGFNRTKGEILSLNATSLAVEARIPAPEMTHRTAGGARIDATGRWLYLAQPATTAGSVPRLLAFQVSDLSPASSMDLPEGGGVTLMPHPSRHLLFVARTIQEQFHLLGLRDGDLGALAHGTSRDGTAHYGSFEANGRTMFLVIRRPMGAMRLVRTHGLLTASLASPPPGMAVLNRTDAVRVEVKSLYGIEQGDVRSSLDGVDIPHGLTWTTSTYTVEVQRPWTEGHHALGLSVKDLFGLRASYSFDFKVDTLGPSLRLNVPTESSSAFVRLSGSWEPTQEIKSVAVSGIPREGQPAYSVQASLDVDSKSFSLPLTLRIGNNSFVVTSEDIYSRKSTVTLKMAHTPEPIWHTNASGDFRIGIPREYTQEGELPGLPADFAAKGPVDLAGSFAVVGVSTFNVTTPPDEEFITATSVVLMEMLKERPGFRLRIPAKSVPISGRTGVYFAVDYRTESLTVRGDVYIVGSERLMKAFLLIVAVPAVSAPEYQETVTYFAHHFQILDSESGQSLLSGYPEVVSVSALAAGVVGACAIVIAYARRRKKRVRLPPPPRE
jgi:hypothetical protein